MGATRFDGQCELVKQASLATCELGRSFGCEQQHMWVANCRGVFSCAGHRVRCGYPPGRPAYNCSCTLPPSPRTWRPEPVLDAASVSAALAASGPSPHVWLDIGISSETLAKWDIMHDSRLIVAGIDALEANVKDAKHPASPRFIRVHGACTDGPPSYVTFNVHESVTCGSLLPTRANAPKLGRGGDACTGDVPIPTRVPSFPLSLVLRRMRRLSRRVEVSFSPLSDILPFRLLADCPYVCVCCDAVPCLRAATQDRCARLGAGVLAQRGRGVAVCRQRAPRSAGRGRGLWTAPLRVGGGV